MYTTAVGSSLCIVAGNGVDGWPQQVYNIVLLLYGTSSACGPDMLVVNVMQRIHG